MTLGRPKGVKDTDKRKNRIPHKSLSFVGQQIGEWLVLDCQRRNERGQMKFKLQCSCGLICYRNVESIAYGKSSSCGHGFSEFISKKQIKPDNYSAKLQLFNSYKSSAKKRNLEFNLTFDNIMDLTSKKCYYCDIDPISKINRLHSKYSYNGIDRVDNSKGYNLSNCVTCCSICNTKKLGVTVNIINKAYKFLERIK